MINSELKEEVEPAECPVCEHKCVIGEGGTGICRMYTAREGVVMEKYPGMLFAIYPVSVESIPMLHFMPNGKFLLISSIGCNFSCPGCVSGMIVRNTDSAAQMMKVYEAYEIVDRAKAEGCSGVVFCLNEPSVSYYTFLSIIKAAKKEGLLAGCSTNGYMAEAALLKAACYLDFVNIGLKGSSPERYRECGAASPDPVFRNIGLLHTNGVHVEVSTMYLPGREDEVVTAGMKTAAVSRKIPFQIMPFMAQNASQKILQPTAAESDALCNRLEEFLDYV